MSRKLVPAAFLAALAVGVAGCAGTSSTSASSSGGTSSSGTLAAAPGFNPSTKTITIGSLVATTGPNADTASFAKGLQLYFEQRNAQDPLGGKYKVDVDVQNSQYTPAGAASAYAQLKGKVALTQAVGAAVVASLAPQAASDDTTIVSSTSLLNEFGKENVVNVGSPYELELLNAIGYAAANQGLSSKTVCAAYHDTPGTASLEAAVKYGLKKSGVSLAKQVIVPATPPSSLSPQIQQLKDAHCQIVIGFLIPPDFILAGAAASQLNFDPQWDLAEAVYNPMLAKSPAGKYFAPRTDVFAYGSTWSDTSVPAIKSLQAAVAAYDKNQKPDYELMHGYGDGIVIAQILSKAIADGDLSHQGISKAIDSLTSIDTGGLFGNMELGPADQRKPSTDASVFRFDASTADGFTLVKKDYSSSLASSYPVNGQ